MSIKIYHTMSSKQGVFIEGNILRTSYNFNEPFDDEHYHMLKRVSHIVFGHAFNQIIDIPPHILSIKFSDNYNKLIVLTPNLISLTFGANYGKCITLGPCVKRVIVGMENGIYNYVKCNIILNKNLVYLDLHNIEACTVFTLCKYLEEFIFKRYYGKIILNYHIKKVILPEEYNLRISLTKKVEILKTGNYFNQILILNKNIRTLKLGFHFNCNIVLSKHLKNVCLSSREIYPTILPPYIKNLHITDVCENILIEHSNINACIWVSGYYISLKQKIYIFEQLPHGVKYVKINFCGKELLKNLPITSHVVKIDNDTWERSKIQVFEN